MYSRDGNVILVAITTCVFQSVIRQCERAGDLTPKQSSKATHFTPTIIWMLKGSSQRAQKLGNYYFLKAFSILSER